MRVILASNRGTLMELGISPIVTASMIIQLLANTKILTFNQAVREDKILYQGAQKLLGLIMAMCEAFAYIWSGAYGDVQQIGSGNCLLIFSQLVFSGIVVMLLDDMLNKGYGLGSGISLFIATNICENIVWKSFSPITITTQQGTEFEGSIINLIHSLLTKDKMGALYHAFYRTSAPNLNNLLATFIIVLIVIYFQGFKVELPIQNHKIKGHQATFPIKLFYTSNYPIILQTALVSNIYFFSQILHKKFSQNFFVKLLGQWQDSDYSQGQSTPIGGLVYFLSPPRDWSQIIQDPLHCIIYILFIVSSCGLFARFWVEISGESASDVANNFRQQDLMVPGYRDTSIIKILERHIPVAATCGGVCIGLLTIVADFLGAIGSGTGILLAVTIIYGYFEQLKKEKDNQQQNNQYVM
ncbi:protein transport protein sec61 alpha subunit, putative [Ichthyophthirius multifiliis]|uniref:Protein transport protein sec61 alpha subunit, putative n=1 Tax=Ichthyophthirius multifiliis TaxID=5932 RepID=G0QW82_ICHMU|nr:protein transport protein sec61 alpha subunit, putative [Ichthyophthirius multifiliis]EGR30505.1 protein transport protein sec61 alpha subunit, putative [Ichthyophthirius multifiliis]|eukprot:XP_004032092.1 protein transport protein sec61 alpha subunit, putative [Ichthyophthirius multifiliis]